MIGGSNQEFLKEEDGRIRLLLTYRQASRLFSLSIDYMQECVKNGSLPYFLNGRKVRFKCDELFDWILKNHYLGIKSNKKSRNLKTITMDFPVLIFSQLLMIFCSEHGKKHYFPFEDSVALEEFIVGLIYEELSEKGLINMGAQMILKDSIPNGQ